jgi:hypothetical protein
MVQVLAGDRAVAAGGPAILANREGGPNGGIHPTAEPVVVHLIQKWLEDE